MILVLLIGLVLIAVSFGLFARTLLMPRLRAAESLRQIDVYGFSGAAQDAAARPGSCPSSICAKASTRSRASSESCSRAGSRA